MEKEHEERYLSQGGIPKADRYLSQINFKAADEFLTQECTQTDMDTVYQYLGQNFDDHLSSLDLSSLRSKVRDLKARIKEQSDSFGDCTTVFCVKDCPELCVKDCPEHLDHFQLGEDIQQVNSDINLIRLTLFMIREGLSIDTFPLSTFHGYIAVQRISKRCTFIPDTKHLWDLVYNYPCIVPQCDGYYSDAERSDSFVPAHKMNIPVEKVSLEDSNSMNKEYTTTTLSTDSMEEKIVIKSSVIKRQNLVQTESY